jgi:hypothetical protein
MISLQNVLQFEDSNEVTLVSVLGIKRSLYDRESGRGSQWKIWHHN